MFSFLNLSMFTQEDGTTNNYKDRKEFQTKILKFPPFCNFLKIEAQAFKAGDFLNIFLKFWCFGSSFFYKIFSYR